MEVMKCSHFSHSMLSVLSPSSSSSSARLLSFPSSFSSRTPVSTSSSLSCSPMATLDEGRRKFLDFPFVSTPHKNLMVDLVSAVEDRLNSQLLPCKLPPDVQCCQSESGTAKASLQIRSGTSDSSVDFILGSWIHSELPTGGSLDITSLSTYFNLSNDSPNFVIELIRTSPTTLVLVLDLHPRKDLVLWPDYLQTFYQDTQLDKHRQALEKIPEVQPYYTPSLYIRAVESPTAIMVNIKTEASGGAERMDEIIRNHLHPISKQVLGIWLDHCAYAKRDVGEAERACLKKRDGVIRSKTIEIDLSSSFPRMFGPEVANRVLEVMREYFTV